MVKVSNVVIITLNVISLLLSVAIIWTAARSSTTCEKFLEKPLIVLGVFLLLVSLAGLVGSCFRITSLMWVYLLFMFLLIVVLLCFTIFAFVVTNKGAGEVLSGRGFKQYRLGDYSNWLQKRMNNGNNWENVRSCLYQAKVCSSLQRKNQTWEEFVNDDLSPIQSGCCKPPAVCDFTYRSGTVWDKPSGFGNNSTISDCNTWSSDQTRLCFDCQSCKAGMLANIKYRWKKWAIANIIALVFLIVVYSVGCCAYKNNRHDNSYRMKGYP